MSIEAKCEAFQPCLRVSSDGLVERIGTGRKPFSSVPRTGGYSALKSDMNKEKGLASLYRIWQNKNS